jgi:DNA-directed RNA polymerase I subunit RPA2
MAIQRDSWAKDGRFTNMGLLLRCVRPDDTPEVNTLHYMQDGTITLAFGNPYKACLPVMLILKVSFHF